MNRDYKGCVGELVEELLPLGYKKIVSAGVSYIKFSIPQGKGLILEVWGNNVGLCKYSRITTSTENGLNRIKHTVVSGIQNAVKLKGVVEEDGRISLYIMHNSVRMIFFFHKLSDIIDYTVVESIPDTAEDISVV